LFDEEDRESLLAVDFHDALEDGFHQQGGRCRGTARQA
jgi:hypothetical protein